MVAKKYKITKTKSPIITDGKTFTILLIDQSFVSLKDEQISFLLHLILLKENNKRLSPFSDVKSYIWGRKAYKQDIDDLITKNIIKIISKDHSGLATYEFVNNTNREVMIFPYSETSLKTYKRGLI